LRFNYLAPTARLAACAAVLAGLALGPALQARGELGSADEFAARLQKKYDTVRDFTADFTQTYEGGVLRKKTSERGKVQVKKPGRMRWSYTSPEPKLFVADGQKMYSYVPADRQVVVSRVPAADEATTPVLFLVGKGNLTRDFTVSFTEVASAPPGTVALRLAPRQRERDYEWLTLVVDRETLGLRMLIAGDNQGGTSTFAFTNLKENVGLPDSTFSFTIPRGADVIDQG
jgi:outer membrane lipoprotein carrier protein